VYGYLRPYLNKVWHADFDGYCSVDQYVLVPNSKRVRPQFVANYLRSPAFLRAAPVSYTPGQLPRIRIDELLETPAPLPSLEAQDETLARLHDAQRAIEHAQAASAAAMGHSTRYTAAVLRSFLKEDNGLAWARAPLGDLADIQLGKMMSPTARAGRRPVPYLRNANVQWDRLDLSELFSMDFTEAEEEKFALEPGDVVACEGGEPGRAAVWRGELTRCCYQKAIHRIRPAMGRLDPDFLVFRLWLGALNGEFTAGHGKSTRVALTTVSAFEYICTHD
jgi:hypothetical protein